MYNEIHEALYINYSWCVLSIQLSCVGVMAHIREIQITQVLTAWI